MSTIYAQKSICQNSLQRVDFQDTALNWSKFSNTGTEIQNIIQNSNTNCLQMRTLEESEVSGHSEVLPFCHLPCSVRGHKVCNVLKWPSREMTYVISRQISGNVKCSSFSQFLIFLGSFLWHCIKQPFAIFDMFDSFWQFLTDNDYGLEPSTLKKLPHFQTAPDVGFSWCPPFRSNIWNSPQSCKKGDNLKEKNPSITNSPICFLWGYDPGNMSVSTYLLLLSWAQFTVV